MFLNFCSFRSPVEVLWYLRGCNVAQGHLLCYKSHGFLVSPRLNGLILCLCATFLCSLTYAFTSLSLRTVLQRYRGQFPVYTRKFLKHFHTGSQSACSNPHAHPECPIPQHLNHLLRSKSIGSLLLSKSLSYTPQLRIRSPLLLFLTLSFAAFLILPRLLSASWFKQPLCLSFLRT